MDHNNDMIPKLSNKSDIFWIRTPNSNNISSIGFVKLSTYNEVPAFSFWIRFSSNWSVGSEQTFRFGIYILASIKSAITLIFADI